MLHPIVLSHLFQEGMEVDTSAALLPGIIGLALAVIMLAALWRIYVKAGQPGWTAIIPIVNIFFLLKVVAKPVWWILLLFIPVVNVIVLLIVYFNLAKVFDHGVLFALGLIFLAPIFMLILGFGGSKYVAANA